MKLFASCMAVLLAVCLIVASLHAGVAIVRNDYFRLGFYRSAAGIAIGELVTAAGVAVILAAAAFAVLRWVAPRLSRTFGVFLTLAAIGRIGWSVARTDYYRGLARALTAPVAIGLVVALLSVTLLAMRRIAREPLRLTRSAGFVVAFALAIPALQGWLLAGRPTSGKGHPSVVLVSLDTVRADHVSCYGYSRPTTPGLDLLAAESTIFETAVAPAPWTLPSHASIFTALYPHNHGAAGYQTVLLPGQVTLAEVLGDAGYVTAGFTGGGYLSSRFGLTQGFGEYEGLGVAPTSEIVDHAIRWLERKPEGRPFFLFVHTYEPHTPYCDGSFARETDAGRVGEMFQEDDLEELRDGRLNPTPEERRYIADLYDGDIHSTDAALSRLWGWLRRSGEIDNTVLVVTSDHGEELFERDVRRSASHGHSLYEELLRVPLVIRHPATFEAGRRVPQAVSLVDIAPTLAAVLGIKWPGRSDGCDLRGSRAGGAACDRDGILSEALRWGRDRRSFRTERYKYISFLGEHREPPELFDLATDPGEHRNLTAELPEIASLSAARMREFPEVVSQNADIDIGPELKRQLRSLGYVQ